MANLQSVQPKCSKISIHASTQWGTGQDCLSGAGSRSAAFNFLINWDQGEDIAARLAEEEQLSISFRADNDIRAPGSRPGRERARSGRQRAGSNAVATLAAYCLARPTLMRAVASLAVALIGFSAYSYLEGRRQKANPTTSEAPRPSAPIPPSPSAVEGARPSSTVPANSANARRVDEVAAPAKTAASAKPVVAQRDPVLDAWFIKSYLRCWTPPASLPQSEKYAAQIRVVHNSDGSLAASPHLVNPPSDPDWRAYADSAVRAVNKCNPLQVPARYAPHFDQWKKMTLYFSPDSKL
jgi:hypothetical protein